MVWIRICGLKMSSERKSSGFMGIPKHFKQFFLKYSPWISNILKNRRRICSWKTILILLNFFLCISYGHITPNRSYYDRSKIPWFNGNTVTNFNGFLNQNQADSMTAALVGCERGSKCEGLFNQNIKNSFQIIVVLSDPFRGMGAQRPSSQATPQGLDQKLKMEVVPKRLRCGTIQKKVS